MTSYADVMRFLNDVDASLSGNKRRIQGGGNSTEPYSSYETFLNTIFGYTSFIFGNDVKNKEDLSESIDLLDQCRQHKEEICRDDFNNEDERQINVSPLEDGDEDIEEKKYQGVLLLKGDELE